MAAAASGAQIPLLNNVLSVPGMPRIAAFLARKLPKRPVRGYTADYFCDYDGCEVTAELRPIKPSVRRGAKGELQASLQAKRWSQLRLAMVVGTVVAMAVVMVVVVGGCRGGSHACERESQPLQM